MWRMGVIVEVLCPERQSDFWRATGFQPVTSYGERVSARELAGRLKDHKAVLLWEAGVVADASAKASIPRRIGPQEKELVKRLTEPVSVEEPPGPVRHRVRYYLDLAAKLGAKTMVAENFAVLQMHVPRAVERVLLVPDSGLGAHYEWPLDRWAALAKNLLENGRQLWIASGTKGAALAKAIPEAELKTLSWPALDDIGSCSLCVAVDGSVPHFAAHVGTTCVVLFGPGEPNWMRPLGRRHVIVRRRAECSPCHATKCRMDLRCQNDLEVEDVLRAIP